MPLTLDGSTGIDFPNGGTHAKAWVNLNGTGTVAIRASGNVSSVTDNGIGQYTLNFTSSISSSNYNIVSASTYATDGTKGAVCLHGGYNGAALLQNTSAVRVITGGANQQSVADMQNIYCSVFV